MDEMSVVECQLRWILSKAISSQSFLTQLFIKSCIQNVLGFRTANWGFSTHKLDDKVNLGGIKVLWTIEKSRSNSPVGLPLFEPPQMTCSAVQSRKAVDKVRILTFSTAFLL